MMLILTIIYPEEDLKAVKWTDNGDARMSLRTWEKQTRR
jgi:hypothetical protein